MAAQLIAMKGFPSRFELKWIALAISSFPAGPTREERYATALSHLEQLCELYGDNTAIREMRKHLSWYGKGLSGVARFRALVNTIGEKQQLLQAIDDFFAKVDHDRE